MAKKNTRIKKDSRISSPTVKSGTVASGGGGTEKEFRGVHTINPKDIENHFGAPDAEPNKESGQSSANAGKADVRLQLDEQIWQKAKLEAARLGLEFAKYVELALDRFKSGAGGGTE